jgi:hypothetical protein
MRKTGLGQSRQTHAKTISRGGMLTKRRHGSKGDFSGVSWDESALFVLQIPPIEQAGSFLPEFRKIALPPYLAFRYDPAPRGSRDPVALRLR